MYLTCIIKKRALGAVLFGLFFSQCQSFVSDKKMNIEGTKAFAAIKRKTPIEKNRRINSYVVCIAKAILSVTKDDTGVKKWEVVVFKSKQPNAFALPGGKIGVYTGILPIANTSGQLAAIIGHEVGHVIARHSKKRYSQQIGSNAVKNIASIFGPPGVGTLVGAGLNYGLLLPFSRSHESEADIIGLRLMSLAGFDPRESVTLWKNMQAASGGKAPPEFASTHPSGKTRIKDLQEKIPFALADYKKAIKQGRKSKCHL